MTDNYTDIKRIKKRFGIIGRSAVLDQSISVAMQVAPTEMYVLLHGESGSGKESFAKIVHTLSARKHNRMVAVNCGAIPPGTIDSELFGHVKGAFTGAESARKGYFEEAEGGTLFLDEIGELPLNAQARLLRVLENEEFIPVGSSKTKKSNVRIIAATHQNLLEAVQTGRFREDLYYRISTVPIYIPALKKRKSDIILLFKHFATEFALRHHVDPVFLTSDAEKVLIDYPFPGNIRQLKNIVQQIALLADHTVPLSAEKIRPFLPTVARFPVKTKQLQREHPDMLWLYKKFWEIQEEWRSLRNMLKQINEGSASHVLQSAPLSLAAGTAPPPSNPAKPAPISLENLSLAFHEKQLIRKALERYNGNRKAAAEALGIAERTLYRKMKEMKI